LEPGWAPGRKAGYHVASSWMMLGEVVRRVTGRPLDGHLRETLLLPLGMGDTWLALPPERFAEYGPRIGVMHDTTKVPPAAQGWDTAEHAALSRPGGNVRGPVRQLGLFYESCLTAFDPRLDRPAVLRPQTMDCLVARHRAGMLDHTFKHVIDWGLGFIVNSSHYGVETLPYSFGRHASPRAFGHGGSQSSAGFADPEHGLVVAVVFNGMPGEAAHNNRIRDVASAVYEDLGLNSHFPPP
jgi:CubicO group peptidase (beta-lactamase class C family)